MLNRVILIIFLVLSGFGNQLFAQEITVYDKVSQHRIPGAKVFSHNPKIHLLTNTEGRFQLERFVTCDSIYVSYYSYQTRAFSYEELAGVTGIELSDNTLTVSEMIVTANRWGQDKLKVPNRITNLNIRDIALMSPQTSADLLETSGYVFVQKSQLAGGSPQLRGFGTNRVMIVVDGVRMNNAIFRSGNLQNVISLDANSLESAEVLFGPGAVMYGSDAIGGVMNFRTKAAKFTTDSVATLLETNVFSRYSSASNEFTSHLDFNFGKEKWAFLTAATYSMFDDLRAGEHGNDAFLRPTYQSRIDGSDSTVINSEPRLQRASAYSQLNVIQKVQYRPNNNWYFDYGFNFSTTSDAPRYDRLTLDLNEDGVLDNAEWYYGPQEWMMHRLAISNTPRNKLIGDQMRMVLAYQNYQESRHDRKTGEIMTRRQFEKVNAFSANLDFEKRIGTRAEIFYGLEAVFNKVGSNAYRESLTGGEYIQINPRYPNGSVWQAYGIYTNMKFDLTDQWIFNIGTRYSLYHIKAEFDTTLFEFPVISTKIMNGSLNGSMGLVYNPNERSQFYVNFSSGFRAPNIDDIGKVFDSEPGSVVVPNVDLKPEYAYNAEIGFVKAMKNRVKIDGALYYTYLEDALARASYTFNGQDSILYEGFLSQVQAVQNLSNAYIYGIQGGIEITLSKGLSLKSKISYQKGFEYSIDSAKYYPKLHVAPIFGRTSLTYKRRHLSLEFYAVYQGKMESDDLPLLERDDHVYALDENGLNYSPSWYTLNIKAAYFFNKHLSATGGVENITNQLYRTYGSGISAPGINFLISLKASF